MTDLSSIAKVYADALFMLSESENCTDEILKEADMLSEIIKQTPDYLEMLDSPAISLDERLSLIDGAFSSFSKILVNTVKLLSERRAARSLPKMLAYYKRAYELSRGIEHVEVISAVLLDDKQKARLKSKLEEMTKKQIIISNTHDPSILGGIKLRYMGKQLDSSLKTRLDAFEKGISELVI